MVVDNSSLMIQGLRHVETTKVSKVGMNEETNAPFPKEEIQQDSDVRDDEAYSQPQRALNTSEKQNSMQEERESEISSPANGQSRRERLRLSLGKSSTLSQLINPELKRNLEAASVVMEETRSNSGSSSSSSLSQEELTSVARRAMKLSKVAAKLKSTKGSNSSTVQKFLMNQKQREISKEEEAKEEVDSDPSSDNTAENEDPETNPVSDNVNAPKAPSPNAIRVPTNLSRSERFAYMRRQHRQHGGADSPMFHRDYRNWLGSSSPSNEPSKAEKIPTPSNEKEKKTVQTEEHGKSVDNETSQISLSTKDFGGSSSTSSSSLEGQGLSQLLRQETEESPLKERSTRSNDNSVLFGEEISSDSHKASTTNNNSISINSSGAGVDDVVIVDSEVNEHQFFSYTESSSKSKEDIKDSSGSISSKQEARRWWKKNYGESRETQSKDSKSNKESTLGPKQIQESVMSAFNDDVFEGIDDEVTRGGSSGYEDDDVPESFSNPFSSKIVEDFPKKSPKEGAPRRMKEPVREKSQSRTQSQNHQSHKGSNVETIEEVSNEEDRDSSTGKHLDETTASGLSKDNDSVFLNLGCGVVNALAEVCPVPTEDRFRECSDSSQKRCNDIVGQAKSRFSRNENVSQDPTFPDHGLTEEERKVWDNWDRVEEINDNPYGPKSSESMSYSSISTGRQNKHQLRKMEAKSNLVAHCRRAMAAYGPQPDGYGTEGSLTKSSTNGMDAGSILKVKATYSTKTATSQSETTRSKKSSSEAVSSKFSSDQRTVLVDFSHRLKNNGVEVLKLNRKNRWQKRFLTVSKEETFLTPDEVGTIGQCPRALLWLKSFNEENQTYSNLRDEGRGGLAFPRLNIIEPGSGLPAGIKIPWRWRRRCKDYGLARVNYSFEGGSRTVLFCFPRKDDASNFCTAVRVIRAVVKREEEVQKQIQEKVNKGVRREMQ